jgi:mannose-6-phosphate isomerase-like protein (cupin superfamily)
VDNYRQLGDISAYVGDDGARIQELAGRSTGLTSHSLALITHPAGTAARAHHHTVADEVYFVRAGQGHIELDGVTRPIGPGDIIEIHPGQRHKVWNDGPGDLDLIVTCAPAYQVSEVAWDE